MKKKTNKITLIKFPSLIIFLLNKIKNRVKHFYHTYILKSPSTVAHNKWIKDRGDENLRLNYPLTHDSIVFDIGSFKGHFAHSINKKYKCFVFCFEPQKFYFKYLCKRFKNNYKIKIFNYGIIHKTYDDFLSIQGSASTLFAKNNINNLKEIKKERIKLKSFNEIFLNFRLKKIDLLEINCEGAEFLLLKHLIKSNLIKYIKHLQVQFHLFYPNSIALRKEIRLELAKTHINKWNYEFVWESWSLK